MGIKQIQFGSIEIWIVGAQPLSPLNILHYRAPILTLKLNIKNLNIYIIHIPYVQEVLTRFISKLLYKMSQDFLNIQYIIYIYFLTICNLNSSNFEVV